LNEFEKLFMVAKKVSKTTNHKPKKTAEFIYVYDPNIELKRKDYRKTIYVYLPCSIIFLDGKKINQYNNTIQLTLLRDYTCLYQTILSNKIKEFDKLYIKMKIIDNRIVNYTIRVLVN